MQELKSASRKVNESELFLLPAAPRALLFGSSLTQLSKRKWKSSGFFSLILLMRHCFWSQACPRCARSSLERLKSPTRPEPWERAKEGVSERTNACVDPNLKSCPISIKSVACPHLAVNVTLNYIFPWPQRFQSHKMSERMNENRWRSVFLLHWEFICSH